MDWTGKTVLTFQEVAAHLKVSVKTVRNWTEGKGTNGRFLKSYELGGSLRTTMEDVNSFTTVRTPEIACVSSPSSREAELLRDHQQAREELRARFGTR